MPLYPSLFYFSTMSSFVYLYSLYVHMVKLYVSVFERLLSVFNVNCMHQGSESIAISILCMYVLYVLRGSKHRSSVPIRTSNRFSPLSDAPTEKPGESALVIGDSIVRNVKIETPATIVHCLPGARAPDILANLKVLANAKRKFSKIVIHAGANDVRLRQSEITKNNVKEVCELASTMSDTVICSGPLPAYRGDEIHSRLSSLNGWMSKWCPQNSIGL